MKILPREPWRGSQICGYQISCGGWSSTAAFCGERKEDGLPYCQEHFWDVMDEYGEVRMAPGNALGDPKWSVRLLWEPYEGDSPEEASYEEMAAYADA